MNNLNIVILAAGQGKRMYSKLPKILHKIGAKPMICHVIEAAKKLNPAKIIIVYGHQGDQVKAAINTEFKYSDFTWVFQDQQLGTGHALKCALPHLAEDGATLVLYGDVPLISSQILAAMLERYQQNIVMLTAMLEDATGYGRVLRNEHSQIISIIEEKDANGHERLIKEVNTGFYVLPNCYLNSWLNSLSNENKQGEYYLTDVIAKAHAEEIEISYVQALNTYEIMGVNNKLQLEEIERQYQVLQADKLLEMGVTLSDKKRIDIRGQIKAGMDCIIDANCTFEGEVVLGNDVIVGVGCILKNVVVGNGVTIKPYTIIENAQVGNDCQIGPYARIRPGTTLAGETHIGNFVEVKNSIVGTGSKVNHLTYIGDAEIGDGVNVGAGSVTCNYDGHKKHKTIIEDKVFVGSGTMLVAPVTIHEGSIIGAGSTITKDTEANELTVARARQVTVKGWVKRKLVV